MTAPTIERKPHLFIFNLYRGEGMNDRGIKENIETFLEVIL